AQGFFHQVTGDELQGLGWSHPCVNENGEGQSQSNPKGTAEKGFLERNYAAAPVPDRQIQEQQNENGGVEDDPETDAHGCALALTSALPRGPILPQAELFQLVIEMSLANQRFDLFAVLPWRQTFRAVGNRKRQVGSDSNVLAQLRQIDLVVRI